MMQAHHFRDFQLRLADGMDAAAAWQSRARLHAQAAFARLAMGRPPIEFIAGPASPHEVVVDGELARLIHYPEKRARGGKGPAVLIVASLINRYYVLDLLPDLSVINSLCERGIDVWVLDWKAPGPNGPRLGFADYLDGVIADSAGEVAARRGNRPPTVIGYCMGGTMAAMFAALHPELVRGLCLLGAPIDFHASGTLADWTRRERFDADLLVDALGNMPPSLMQSGFKLMNPFDAWQKLVGLARDAEDDDRVRQFVALEAWLDDNIAFPGGVYREYIGRLYQDNALIGGGLRVGDRAVDLKRLTVPLLNVIALRDHICAPPSSRALMDLVGSTDRELVEFDTGHIGLTTSRRSLRDLWPRIAAWIEARG